MKLTFNKIEINIQTTKLIDKSLKRYIQKVLDTNVTNMY